jgi:hypothetical protein
LIKVLIKEREREKERERVSKWNVRYRISKKKTEKNYHVDHDEESIDYILLNQKY